MISIISGPQEYQPAYNAMEFTFNSTNKAQCEFSYIVDLYINNAFAVRLKEFPKGANQYGQFRIERIIQDYLSFDFHPDIDDFTQNNNSIASYYLEVRESYNSTVDCTGLPTIGAISYTSPIQFAWNGALQYNEFPDYVYTLFVSGSPTSRFLTNAPNNLKVRPEDFFVLNILAFLDIYLP